ncbi:Wzz/FepE/Etk N-terminal domain-containing protein, partial [Chloroflexus sp.]|uniref:Wzz/FepE/Etk N-terminal domain-containing protein n=1 Tax=Chloroflexus sp. TaxID=1904827 RepID=UPI004049BF98
GLIKDFTLEERVVTLLAAEGVLIDNYKKPGDLLDRIETENEGDLIRVKVRANTAEKARRLATVWVQEFAEMVIEDKPDQVILKVEQQLAEAEKRYREAQEELEEFIAKGELDVVGREVQLLRDLIGSTSASLTERYANYLRRFNDLEQVLRDARLLRQRLVDREVDEASAADAIAALLLRTRNLSDTGRDRPILQLDSSLVNNAVVTATELDRFITILENERRAVHDEAENLSRLELSPDSSQSLYERLAAAQARLEQLSGRQRELIQERDVAFELAQLLLRRIDELRISDAAPQVSVRYLGTVTNPEPAIARSVVTQAAIGALAGIFLAAFIIVVLEAVAIARRNTALTPKPAGD